MMINWKEIFKKFAPLYWLNARIKAYKLKRDLARLACEYESKAASSGFSYDAEKAVDEFKRCHQRYRHGYAPVPYGALRVFWVGTHQSQDESGFLQALNRLAKVTVFHNIEGKYGIWSGNATALGSSTFAEIRRTNDETLLKQVVQAHADEGIDVLLGQMRAGLVSKEVLAKVQAMGIPVINISMDDRLPEHWTHEGDVRLGPVGLAPNLDMVLTTSPETCLWYGVDGCSALFWPLASDPKAFAPSEGAVRDIDVLFIGNRYGVRGKIVAYLERYGIKVDCYGNGWANGYVNAEQNTALSKRARIILGVGTVGHCSDVYTLKLRDFDALMTGALYITHRNPDLCRIFKEGVEMECYGSPQDAAEKIRYYLDHHVERDRIGRMGQKKAMAEHNWDDRLGSTFRQLGLLQSNNSHNSSAKKYA
jgi:spore maturation protein CgeB